MYVSMYVLYHCEIRRKIEYLLGILDVEVVWNWDLREYLVAFGSLALPLLERRRFSPNFRNYNLIEEEKTFFFFKALNQYNQIE